ncbi:hypothetical protein AB1N83_009411 [Pleurotus pulmonarius]
MGAYSASGRLCDSDDNPNAHRYHDTGSYRTKAESFSYKILRLPRRPWGVTDNSEETRSMMQSFSPSMMIMIDNIHLSITEVLVKKGAAQVRAGLPAGP